MEHLIPTQFIHILILKNVCSHGCVLPRKRLSLELECRGGAVALAELLLTPPWLRTQGLLGRGRVSGQHCLPETSPGTVSKSGLLSASASHLVTPKKKILVLGAICDAYGVKSIIWRPLSKDGDSTCYESPFTYCVCIIYKCKPAHLVVFNAPTSQVGVYQEGRWTAILDFQDSRGY